MPHCIVNAVLPAPGAPPSSSTAPGPNSIRVRSPTPKGKHTCVVCTCTACYVKGADRLLAANDLGQVESLLEECPPHLRGWEWNYLKRRFQAGPVTELPSNSTPASGWDVAFSPDGKTVAAGLGNGDVKIWDLSVEALRSRLEGANADCLLPEVRATYLEEDRNDARDLYVTCERRHGRVPLPEAP